ncbi:MAG: adenylate/guanylate cyclase domain-containing protein [Methylotenera sp.]|nr:adenylate/guanylate cyclase domain-containing protein [Oligoflexia bacterium]
MNSPPALHVQDSHEFRHSIEEIWDAVSDTDRSNQRVGLPPVVYQERTIGSLAPARFGQMKVSGMHVEWREYPYEWIRGSFIQVKREYVSGPLKAMTVHWKFSTTARGCLVEQSFEFVPRFRFTGKLLAMQLRSGSLKSFKTLYRQLDERLSQKAAAKSSVPGNERIDPRPENDDPSAPKLDRKKEKQWREKLGQQGIEEEQARKLLDFVFRMDSQSLIKIRPFELAALWSMNRIEVLTLLLRASRAGALSLSWDLVCPSCRGAKARFESLSDLKGGAHCSFCNIHYDAVFDQSVELSFRVHPSLREVLEVDYCIGSPRKTSHFLSQLRSPAGSSQSHVFQLDHPGIYVLRSLQYPREQEIHVVEKNAGTGTPGTGTALDFIISPSKSEALLPITVAPGRLEIRIENRSLTEGDEVVCVLHRNEWLETACTAAYVTSFQEFRDIFSREVIRQDMRIEVSTLAILFTDLKDSTAIYDEMGDAQAFGLVTQHLEVLTQCVKEHEGAVVKTAGDSVMATFTKADRALEAALAMQAAITRFNETSAFPDRKLQIKIGINQGPCFAVNLNDRLDFFGKNVNIAARAQGFSEAGEIVVTAGMMNDPAVRSSLLRNRKTCTQVVSQLKGFAQEFELYRVT